VALTFVVFSGHVVCLRRSR